MREFGTTNFAPYAIAPAVGPTGSVYFNTTSGKVFISNGSVWIELSSNGPWEDLGAVGSSEILAGSGLVTRRYSLQLDQAVTTITVGLGLDETILVRINKNLADAPAQSVVWVNVFGWYTADGKAPPLDPMTLVEFSNVLGLVFGRVLGGGVSPDSATALHGTWIVRQTSGSRTSSAVDAAASAINVALSTPFNCIGLSCRYGWGDLFDGTTRTLNTVPLEAGWALANAKGKLFAPRFMCGQHTPYDILNDSEVVTALDQTGTYAGCQVTAGQRRITRAAGFPSNINGLYCTSGYLNGQITWIDATHVDVSGNVASSSSSAFTLSVSNDPNAAGNKVPLPFGNTSGTWNDKFEDYYGDFIDQYAAWCRTKTNVPLMHCANYSKDYSELYNMGVVTGAPAYSADNFAEGHARLFRLAFANAGYDLQIEYPLSGAGPLAGVNGVATKFAQKMVDHAGPNSPFTFFQGNGWGNLVGAGTGTPMIYSIDGPDTYLLDATAPNNIVIWGNSSAATEDSFDYVMEKPMRRAVQAAQPIDYPNIADMYARAVAAGADYVEMYPESFATNMPSRLLLRDEIDNFAALV